ncbi:MAG: Unknown protein [uncultured Sulfurovum sp.]|uniref:Lipoprotein n=1 Tax=uncultured Sulfurovum sp. TaxID=269237 RepID=A0A6S6TT69_9BACT|nr:MAG: Unknown protein [uncultured Sulfurovum sp.]
MKTYLLTPFVSLIFIACGGGSDETSSKTAMTSMINPSMKTLNMSVNNMGHTIEEKFNNYLIKVGTSVVLDDAQETSKSTIAVYGTINNLPTNALLKLNTNYLNSDIRVLVFENNQLVGQSALFTVSSTNPINFGEITIK